MTQNTLSEEIERELEVFDEQFSHLIPTTEQYEQGVSGVLNVHDYEQLRDSVHHSLCSIAEKTVEAVRVEKDPVILRQDGVSYDFDAVEGFNQAITEQSKLAARWLGKEEV